MFVRLSDRADLLIYRLLINNNYPPTSLQEYLGDKELVNVSSIISDPLNTVRSHSDCAKYTLTVQSPAFW